MNIKILKENLLMKICNQNHPILKKVKIHNKSTTENLMQFHLIMTISKIKATRNTQKIIK